MGLETYHKKRDFRRTPEPKGKLSKANRHRFVMQEHHASKLHFDFRLEMGGVLKSWSVPRGPSLDPADKRLAVETEDHPVEYLKFEGHIPEGEYGAGEHMIWDEGTYKLADGGDALEQLEAGRLNFELRGKKLRGSWNLVRLGGREGQWLLMKARDEFAESGWKLELRMPDAGFEKKEQGSRKSREKSASKAGVKTYSTKERVKGKAVSARAAFNSKSLSGEVDVKIGGDTLQLTNLDKVFWPDEGYTKGDLIRYYYEVSKYILPYLKDRPLIMKRYPNGIRGSFFHQHDVNEAPDYVRTEEIDVEEGHKVDYIIGDNVQALLYMANLGAIERHPWHSRVADLGHPDWFVFDLDPSNVEFEEICDVALKTRDILERLGLESYVKTSGSRGIHVYVPLKPGHTYEEVAEFAERVAELVVEAHPDVATVERSLKKRKRRAIYVDHMQNARGKSVVAPYSVRPKPGATVSAPLEWKEVEGRKIRIEDFTIKNMLRRIERKGELFKPVLKSRQTLQKALALLDETAQPKGSGRRGG
ncbi:MAG TPA: non-homologous end-joining DNA ligase [Pyrinomonadaceae bacterium]|jgi:bifunctional non-homologous end joining protein LigD